MSIPRSASVPARALVVVVAAFVVAAGCVGPRSPTADAPTAEEPVAGGPIADPPTPLQFARAPGIDPRGAVAPAALDRADADPEDAGPADPRAPRAGRAVSSIGVADLDRDGVLDLLFNPARRLSVLRGGSGRFLDYTTTWLPPLVGVDQVLPFAADGDAPCLAVLARGEIHVLAADARRAYVDVSDVRLPAEHRAGHRWIESVDLDDDGDIDLVAGGRGGIRIFGGEDEARFFDRTDEWLRSPAGAVRRIFSLDVDRDGECDLLLCGATLRLLHNDGSGRLTDETDGRLPVAFANPASVVAIDFDRDRIPELLVIGRGGELAIWRDAGVGQFVVAEDLRVVDWAADPVAECVAADVDGDGREDLVTASVHGLALWINDGRNWLRPEPWRLPDGWHVIARQVRAVDLDADGAVDLVVGVPDGLALLQNDGRGHFVDASTQRLPPKPR